MYRDACSIDGRDVCSGYAFGDDICAQNRDLTKKMAILNAKLDLIIERLNITRNDTIPLFPASGASAVVSSYIIVSLAIIFTSIALFQNDLIITHHSQQREDDE